MNYLDKFYNSDIFQRIEARLENLDNVNIYYLQCCVEVSESITSNIPVPTDKQYFKIL